jgi:hypothetical protein
MFVSNGSIKGGDGLDIRNQLTVTGVLRALPVLALGLVAVFLAAVFLVVGAFSETGFLGPALAAFYCN